MTPEHDDPETERAQAIVDFIAEAQKHVAHADYCRRTFRCPTPFNEHLVLFPVP